jgi:hypothetical protein
MRPQGDANGDGMVDGIDYDMWRSQFNTPIDGGGGLGTAAASAAALSVAEPASFAHHVTASLSTSSNDRETIRVASVKDAAFGMLSGWTNESRRSRRGAARQLWFATGETGDDLMSLLTIVASRKNPSRDNGSAASTAENPKSEMHADCPFDGALGLAFRQFFAARIR